jgi:glycosyltransferase involved in cell wall biosynthesis
LVSVVIASYNHRGYVEEAVRSVVTQAYHPLEVIVIDDGSTDGSAKFLESLKGRFGFRLICRQNGGLVSVINLGIQEAAGTFVVFHASDDRSLAGRIAGQVDVLSRHPKAAFVSGNVSFMAESGRNRGILLPISGKERELGFDDLFLHRAKASSVASMYRADALKAMGQLDESYTAEDAQLFLRLTHLGYSWIQWCGPPVIEYRMLASSQSRTVMPLLVRQHLRLTAEFANHPLYPEAAARTKTALLSALADHDKRAALRELATGGFEIVSANFVRVAVKLLMPKTLHRFFKRAGI